MEHCGIACSLNDYFCLSVLKPEIMKELEKHRDEELKVRKEKRLKEAEEEKKKQVSVRVSAGHGELSLDKI